MLSIIIPTLNAEASVAATLNSILAPAVPGVDVLVVDGGSTDATLSISAELGVKAITCAPGRGRQLARGAAEAKAAWLLFVHADTRLPEDWAQVVSRFITVDINRERAGYFR